MLISSQLQSTTTSHQPQSIPGESILNAFSGSIKSVRTSPVYQLGLLVVALAMILLPLIYMALILSVIAGVVYHAVVNVTILQSGDSAKGSLVLILIYITPIVVGFILVLFMIKPLFARRAVIIQSHPIDPSQEPLFSAFIEKICKITHAPIPHRIEVDCQVNASAAFRGGLLSFLRRDLILTVGLPLVSGLNMRELAGVLAHEFGHFSQGTAMRLTYIIRTINSWFANLVYERDAFDENLKRWSAELDFRFAVALYLAKKCVEILSY